MSSTGLATIDGGFGIDPASCHGNCVIQVPWNSGAQLHKTLGDLILSSADIVVGNVTAISTVAVKGVPVTVYNVTLIAFLYPLDLRTIPSPGTVFTMAQVGGTAAGNTMTLKGYPPLVKGGTYVFFLNLPGGSAQRSCGAAGVACILIPDPTAPYVGGVDGGFASVTVGGPQGVFSVQGGNVYSMDNLHPQEDAWLPLKVSGVPLAQFITQIQQAAASGK